MKYFIITFTFLLLFNGCSNKNAYSHFNMSLEEELFESNTQNSKIEFGENIKGTFTVTYLNNIDKNISKKEDQFLVSIYMKDKNQSYEFKLNNIKPIRVEKLPQNNRYMHFLKLQTSWYQNSLVIFKKTTDDLNITFYSDQSTSVLMNFLKE